MPRPASRAPEREARAAAASPAPSPARARRASDTYARLYAVVRRIPRGRVATYGQVAAVAGMPRHARLAGYALHALPDGSPLPWHRVVGAGGRLSLARISPDGALTQRMRLEREGVAFDPAGRVRLARHAWKPRSRARGKAVTNARSPRQRR